MDDRALERLRIERQELFTRIAGAFARRAFDEVTEGVVPDVTLTLRGSSWLAGTYRGYQEFSYYILAARLVLEPVGKPMTYLHHGVEMVIMHEFEVGGRVGGPEIPMHISVQFGADGRLSSLVIQAKDQPLFDRAVNSFLRPEVRYGETA